MPCQRRSHEDHNKAQVKFIYCIKWRNSSSTSSIGKRYYRQDEAGTPFCITIDHESKENNTVTLRNRDDQKQDRVPINDLKKIIQNRMEIE